jgi:hypothetical protein
MCCLSLPFSVSGVGELRELAAGSDGGRVFFSWGLRRYGWGHGKSPVNLMPTVTLTPALLLSMRRRIESAASAAWSLPCHRPESCHLPRISLLPRGFASAQPGFTPPCCLQSPPPPVNHHHGKTYFLTSCAAVVCLLNPMRDLLLPCGMLC